MHISRKNLFITLGIVLFIFIISIGGNSTTTPTTSLKPNQENQEAVIATKSDNTAELATKENVVHQQVQENNTPVKQNSVAGTTITAAPQYAYHSVVSVVDGDTIKINMDGKQEVLRLIGIDTPETVDPRKPVQCFGREASNKAKEILSGKKIRIETDSTQGERDKYDRLLAYIYREDGLFYNKYMIQQGYAHEYTYNTPYKYQAEFKAAEKYARENQLGLWSPNTCNGVTTTPASAPQNVPIQNNPAPSQTGSGKYYTSSHYTAKYYYPEACPEWQSLSPSYLKSFSTLGELLAKYPSRIMSPQCQ